MISGGSSLEALQAPRFANEQDGHLLRTISIACEAKCDLKLALFLPT